MGPKARPKILDLEFFNMAFGESGFYQMYVLKIY